MENFENGGDVIEYVRRNVDFLKDVYLSPLGVEFCSEGKVTHEKNIGLAVSLDDGRVLMVEKEDVERFLNDDILIKMRRQLKIFWDRPIRIQHGDQGPTPLSYEDEEDDIFDS